MKGFAKKFSLLLLLACLALCCACLAAGTGENASNADGLKKIASDKYIRIALCHLDLAQGAQEKNIQKIENAIHIAGRNGANWIITPETALQGYYFYVIDPKQKDIIEEQPSDAIRPLLDASSSYGAYLFLGAGEYDKRADCYRNSCLIFGPDGKLMGRHSKMTAHVGFGAEVWSTNDYKLNPVICSDVKTGVLVCSDIWFPSFPVILADKGARIIVDIAAWPPAIETGNPLPSWELASRRANRPVVVCNQTGKPRWLDMTPGQSAVVENGKAKLMHSGAEAVLLFDWDPVSGKVISEKFEKVL